MKINYNWIKEFVDIRVAPEKLADKLSMAGLSVASLDKTGNDWVYDIEVTSNRPDWLSVRGIVHEISAITGAKLKKKDDGRCLPVGKAGTIEDRKKRKNNRSLKSDHRPFFIIIEDTKDCKFYYGNIIRGVKVGPSPDWLKSKLEILGLRSVNNIVDVTNFCLLELGQPLHAFDYEKIISQPGAIVVRRAKKSEEIVTLDGISRKLNPDVLVIASGGSDNGRPLAVAGIMGGADTEVGEKTVNILLESACFDSVVVRRASRSLGIASDSSYRFERGVDEATVKAALERATELITELCGGELAGSKRAGILKEKGLKKINFDLSESVDLLGVKIPSGEAKSIFQKLGFGVKARTKEKFEITVPSFRRDISIAEDLAEELVRVWGYENIPLTQHAIKSFQMDKPALVLLGEKVKETLIRAGLKEVITYSLIGESDYQKTGLCVPDSARVLVNPLSRENSILRTTLLPSVLNCISFNVSRNNRDLEVFETARVFADNKEELVVSFALCGKKRASWLSEALNYTLFDLKGLIEVLLESAGINNCVYQDDAALAFAESSTGCRVVFNNETLAVFCQVSTAVKKAWGIKSREDVFVAEVALERLNRYANLKRCFSEPVSFPGIIRDVSILTSRTAPYSKIKLLIETEARDLVRSMAVVETYSGKEVPKGSLSLTISIEYGSSQRTLTDEEVNLTHQKVLSVLVDRLGVKIR